MSVASTPRPPLIARLDELYNGFGRQARMFRIALLIFDIFSLAFFAATSIVRHEYWVVIVDVAIAAVIVADLLARYLISTDTRSWLTSFESWTDIAVILSLLGAAVYENLLFLRALRLLRSYRVLAELRSSYSIIRRNYEQIKAVVNVVVFVFVMASIVFIMQVGVNQHINHYLDALYFTITALTTTGFGDVVLVGSGGKLLSIVIMLVGVSLFIRMLQAILRPTKVRFTCPDCGLRRHDFDASHCKACGRVLAIEDDGAV
ncbi:MAG: potassium channel family protein [Hyphomicrobiaceae bacterium]